MYILTLFQKYCIYQNLGDDITMKQRKNKKRALTFYLERQALRREIEQTRHRIDSARNHFEQVVDPTLIDCYIYEVNSVLKRYKFLLEQAAKMNLLPEEELHAESPVNALIG